MYIPVGPSKKQLYKIVIGLLLLCYILFLGMYKPKAYTFADYWSTSGLSNNNYYWTKSGEVQAGANVRIDMTNSQANLPNFPNKLLFNAYLKQEAQVPGVLATENYDGECLYQSNGACYYWNTLNGTGVYFNYNDMTCKSNLTSGSEGTFYFSVECDTNGVYKAPLTAIVTNNSNKIVLYKFGISYYINAYNNKSNDTQTINNINTNTANINTNITDVKDTINDSSIDSSSANDLTINSAFQDSNGLDAIIKAPLNFIQSLTSSTCSSISLTIPYIDADVSLPCMSTIYNKALGQQLVNLIALVINGVVLYRYCLKILQLVHNAKNPNKDELEVLDL